MRLKKIDLRNKNIIDARRSMKRLIAFRNDKAASVQFYFLLPAFEYRYQAVFYPSQLKSNCPYCSSSLVETEAGIVCSGDKFQDVIFGIRQTEKKYGDQAYLFLSKRENRFYDEYRHMGRDTACDYVLGNEERKYRINNRLLMPGVDRNKIKSNK